MKNKSYILIYDSGIGGLTTLASIQKLLPKINIIYYGDIKNCPYGSKCKTELQHIILNNLKSLINRCTISHIVLACNTATTATIEYLRSKITIPIIGTEPNVREPSKLGYKYIALLATPVTVKEEKLLNLEKSLNTHSKNIGIKKLAKLIDDFYVLNKNENYKKSKILIKSKLKNIPTSNAIVLGCTHYVYMKPYIESLGFKCFDGNEGVAKRLKHLIQNTMSHNENLQQGQIIFKTGNVRSNLIYRKIYKNYSKSLK